MYLKTEDVDLYYERTGEGQPMILIHGAVADADYFSESVPILRKFYDVITYDRRGNSRSTPKEGATFQIADQVKDVVALIEALDLQQVILVGHSAGGEMALETFRVATSRIARVILYETPLLSMITEQRPDMPEWIANMEALNASGKHREVAKEFGLSIGVMDKRARKKNRDEKQKDRMNFGHFINHEFHAFSYYEPDIDFCRVNRDYITAVVGDGSEQTGSHLSLAMRIFAETVGCDLYHLAGFHNLPYDLPKDFVAGVLGILSVIEAKR